MSFSETDLSISSVFRVGKMRGGLTINPPRTDKLFYLLDIRTSFNSRISFPLDVSQLLNSFR